MPDDAATIERIARIARFAARYGLALELSLLSPLEIGPAFRAQTGESGVWMQARKGLRDPATGRFSVGLWLQQRWVNNKGVIALEDAGVRAFAFRERAIPGTPYRAVEPGSIVELHGSLQVEQFPGLAMERSGYRALPIRVHGSGAPLESDLDRVMVVQIYRTPEMDYLSDRALPFLTQLLDRYADAAVPLNGLYSDEMHIQQDWGYAAHHDHGEFTLRYVSDGLVDRFARTYGEHYRDFAPYLLYFVSGQEDAAHDLSAKADISHVMGDSPAQIAGTALFRSRYYRMLQDGVVDLFVAARQHLERRLGHRLETRAHATWAESPTIDVWAPGKANQYTRQYEYTSDFVWSNTVHQAAAACHDYFKWGEYLTGTGNDHAECGWLDRNYLGLALACSTGIINEIPYSYAAHWGMPDVVARRRQDLVNCFGAAGEARFGVVQEMQHRDVEVLLLYPLDLVAVDPRFGSWMVQFGYANLITQSALLRLGRIEGGAVHLAGRRFSTLVASFEPFPDARLFEMMRALVEGGGRVVWSGPPPLLTAAGEDAREAWQTLFGCGYDSGEGAGRSAPGSVVHFEGALAAVPPQTVLTHLLVDRIYPLAPHAGTAVVARLKGTVVGTHRSYPGGGTATPLGYRPRDDQSRSLGSDERNLFDVLHALGAYAPSGIFAGVNDNTEYLSRTGAYLCCRFPNGSLAVAPHLRELEESWPGGFARDPAEDRRALEGVVLPSRQFELEDFHVNGHRVTYRGEGTLVFRTDAAGALLAFAGSGSDRIVVDGRQTVFAERRDVEVAWAPVAERRRLPRGAVAQIMVSGPGWFRIPLPPPVSNPSMVAEGVAPGSAGTPIPFRLEDGALVFDGTTELSGRWIYVVDA